MKKFLFVLAVLIAASLALSACAGGGPSNNIRVTFTDFQFSPNEFTIPAGQEITVNATNNGAVEHEFVIFKFGKDAGEKFGDEDEENIFWEVKALPGETKIETFTAPTEPGEYYITCGTEGHLEAGMSGSLTVVAP